MKSLEHDEQAALFRWAAIMARKRYALGTGGRRKGPYTGPQYPVVRPWAWIENCFGERGEILSKRRILHVLESQTQNGAWPWPDVLAGAGPCIMDECPF